jgi:hypothetical protein
VPPPLELELELELELLAIALELTLLELLADTELIAVPPLPPLAALLSVAELSPPAPAPLLVVVPSAPPLAAVVLADDPLALLEVTPVVPLPVVEPPAPVAFAAGAESPGLPQADTSPIANAMPRKLDWVFIECASYARDRPRPVSIRSIRKR